VSERRLFLYGLVFELGLGAIGLLGGVLTGVSASATIRLETRAVFLGLVATVPLLVFFALSWRSSRAELRAIRTQLERLLPRLLGGLGEQRWLGVLALAIAAGIGEELLFRGFLQGTLENALGATFGLLAASIVFGLVHAITPTYATIATLMGLYLGLMWRWSGNLFVPITIHAAYDAAVIAYVLANGISARESST
jgi:membrane protease YdiL (CAAX protease family)